MIGSPTGRVQGLPSLVIACREFDVPVFSGERLAQMYAAAATAGDGLFQSKQLHCICGPPFPQWTS